MELNDEILNLCKSLKLSTIAEEYHTIASTAAKENWQYVQFLHELLKQESDNRMDRSKNVLTKSSYITTCWQEAVSLTILMYFLICSESFEKSSFLKNDSNS